MNKIIDFDELTSITGLAMLRLASVVIACDEDTELLLYSQPVPGGHLLQINFESGGVLFEGKELLKACEKVAAEKGCCLFDFSAKPPAALELADEFKPTNRIRNSLPLSEFLRGTDDDEPTDWWKRGDA